MTDKDNFTSDFRRRIFWAMVMFTTLMVLISAACTTFTLRFNLKSELKVDLENIEVIRGSIEARLDQGLEAPFRYVELFDGIDPVANGYSYAIVNSETGEIIAPANADPVFSSLDFSTYEDRTLIFRRNGKKVFSMYSDFVNHPYRLVNVISFRYVFFLADRTAVMFLLTTLLLTLAMLTVFWKCLLKRLEHTVFTKHQAEMELSNASKLQNMAVTHDFPDDPRCDVFGLVRPTREIGGDLYGCYLNGDDLFFIIGDVSDKGSPAAFVMFLLSSIVYPLFKNKTPIRDQAKALNTILCDNSDYDMFCTAIIGRLDLNTRRMEIINAGHTRMLANGQFFNATPNLPLGVMPNYPYAVDSLSFEAGSTIVLYTDGVTEERSETREFFGESGIIEWWKKEGKGAGVKDSCIGLSARLEAWRGRSEQSDDIAIMTIKLK